MLRVARVNKPKKSYMSKFNSESLKRLGKTTQKQGKSHRVINPTNSRSPGSQGGKFRGKNFGK